MEKKSKSKTVYKNIALAGNPNVGKSTLFNLLTGGKQHTGNWSGKTVGCAFGEYNYNGVTYKIVDLPGTYSLFSSSEEERIARNYICFENNDLIIAVCDATRLEKSLNIVLQILEATDNVIVCVNLIDEAKKRGISLDLQKLSNILGVCVVGISAKRKNGINELSKAIESHISTRLMNAKRVTADITYSVEIENSIKELSETITAAEIKSYVSSRFISLRLIDADEQFKSDIKSLFGESKSEIEKHISETERSLSDSYITKESFSREITEKIINTSEKIAAAVTFSCKDSNLRDRKVDKILTSNLTGIPVMLLLLFAVFWITITGANYPSKILSFIFSEIEQFLLYAAEKINVSDVVCEMLILGVWRFSTWVISVMLPPMAIFFPLFAFLEELGYLPRIAFNLDGAFKKCAACGKQALTMCMGFGCNAVGVTGARIIDSPREKLIAIITNSLVPCNGRFPSLIAIITIFFTMSGAFGPFAASLILTATILLGVFMTFLISKLLSKTLLKGTPSTFILELPPYRMPNLLKTFATSIKERIVFVLARAAVVAIPAGLIIWILANASIDGTSLLAHCNSFLDPLGKLMGMDGTILFAFILALPANEVVIPIIVMSYLSEGTISDYGSLDALKSVLVSHGWTVKTAICTAFFILFHWPCSTTLLTIKKETRSTKWMLVSLFIPTAIGIIGCILISLTFNIFSN